jgi:bis(5'-nucleosyl)-tetraphosphatase (symmetrical)
MENILQSENPLEFFSHMYGNHPNEWQDDLKGWDRYRYITNVFTRMRFCDAQGRPDFKYKGDIGSQPDHLQPWFMHENRLTKSDDIIFGHWSTLTNIRQPHIYAIDTGCLWCGKLTALRLDNADRTLTQIDCPNGIKPV